MTLAESLWAATPSVIMVRQNGQPTATVLAPVAKASPARREQTRFFGSSSIHIRPPPAPQQNVFSRLRGISQISPAVELAPPDAALKTPRGDSWMPFTRAR